MPLWAQRRKLPSASGVESTRNIYTGKGVIDVQIHPDISHTQADSGSTYASHVHHSNLLTSYGLKAQCATGFGNTCVGRTDNAQCALHFRPRIVSRVRESNDIAIVLSSTSARLRSILVNGTNVKRMRKDANNLFNDPTRERISFFFFKHQNIYACICINHLRIFERF